MTENTNFSNDLILIEELEPKIAPSGVWDVADYSTPSSFQDRIS